MVWAGKPKTKSAYSGRLRVQASGKVPPAKEFDTEKGSAFPDW